MKLISLNAWAGRSLYQLMRFLRNHREDTDIFCLQEVLDTSQAEIDKQFPREYMCASLFQRICDVLPEHIGYFAGLKSNPEKLGVATFVRKNVEFMGRWSFPVYIPTVPRQEGGFVISERTALAIEVRLAPPRACMIVNLHGLWTGGEKNDTPERIWQSKAVKAFITSSKRKMICGDFNLLPCTQSMRILEKGMRNLVCETGVESTRTVLYRHFDDPAYSNFADYALVGIDIAVSSFRVLPDIVSDHSPLELVFS